MDEPTISGGLINCALFLAGVILAGVMGGNHLAVVLALLSVAAAVIDYTLRGFDRWRWAVVVWVASNALAAAAFAALVRGYGLI